MSDEYIGKKSTVVSWSPLSLLKYIYSINDIEHTLMANIANYIIYIYKKQHIFFIISVIFHELLQNCICNYFEQLTGTGQWKIFQ